MVSKKNGAPKKNGSTGNGSSVSGAAGGGAAAAIFIGGKAVDLQSAVGLAKESLDSGKAFGKLENLIEITNA